MEKYIAENFLHFDPVIFFERTSKDLTREEALQKFEQAIDNIASDTKQSYNLVRWCLNIQESSYQVRCVFRIGRKCVNY